MSKSNCKGSENRQNHRSWAAQSAHRASAGPMVDRREKRLGTRAERTERRISEDWDWTPKQ